MAASQDTWIVDADIFRDFNAGTDAFVWVDGPANAPTGGLIAFDLASIGAGSSVTSATLRLHHQANQQFGQYLRAYRNLTAWSENTATASNAPAFDPTPVAELLVLDGSVDRYREWDVTSVVQSWVKGTFVNAGFRLGKDVTGGASPYFASREASLGVPELVVTYRAAVVSDAQSVVPEPSTGLMFGAISVLVLLATRLRS
ncbi:MAG: DNRLRE domain-containing protein [Acidobacteria bacterium]|nr:DNRLRE domain-containing protein [Acidobacteriota bacterium]